MQTRRVLCAVVGVLLAGAGLGVSGASSAAPAVATPGSGVYAWGLNHAGQLGDGTTTSLAAPAGPVSLPSGTTATAVAGGGEHSLAVTSTGSVYSWGDNASGQLGDGTTSNRSSPVSVHMPAGVTVIGVAGGSAHSLAVTSSGSVYAWGSNAEGQIGDGTTTGRLTPTRVSLPAGVSVTAVSAGAVGFENDVGVGNSNLALTSTGAVYAWGSNDDGQLGDGTTTDRSLPVRVALPAEVTVTMVAAGVAHGMALTSTGGVYSWGANLDGQIGDGTLARSATPVPVHLPEGVTAAAIAAGGYRSYLVTPTGLLYGWGANAFAELGDGTTASRLTPIPILMPSGVRITAVALGMVYTTAVTTTGAVYAWGSPANDLPDRSILPAPVSSLSRVAAVAAGAMHSLAIASSVVLPGVGAVVEGNTGTVNLAVPVTLSLAAPAPVTVQWNTLYAVGAPAGQADPATDYTPASGTVTFAPGETAKTVPIVVNGDTLIEPSEYLVVSFHDPTNATLGGFWGLGFGVITADDNLLTPGVASTAEGNSGSATVQVPVTLSNSSTQPVTVQWNTLFASGAPGNQADPATDYTPASGVVTFAPGETTRTVPITVHSDAMVEPDEYIVVSFHNPANGAIGGFWGLGFGSITNDD